MNTIFATYNITLTWDLENLGIDPKDIEKYYIKYRTLHIKLNNNEEWFEFEPENDPKEFDFKYPNSVDNDWEV